MKTRSHGDAFIQGPPGSDGMKPLILEQCPDLWVRARESYKEQRMNGRSCDSPSRDIPYDGRYSGTWATKGDKKGWFRIRYNTGPGDRAWMEERDRNYLSRLAHSGDWDEFDSMKSARKAHALRRGKSNFWPKHLEEFATKLEADYRITSAQDELQEKVSVEYEALVHEQVLAETERTAWKPVEYETKDEVEQETRAVITSAVTAQAEGRHEDVLGILDTYLREHPCSVEALKLRAHSREQLASRAPSRTESKRYLEAAAMDFNALLDIDVADTEASDGLERVNALLNPSTSTPEPTANPTVPLFERLGRVWRGKYGEPVYVPVSAKADGCAVGAIYLKEKTKPGSTRERRRWLGKTGYQADVRDGRSSDMRSLIPSGVSMPFIREMIAAHAYDLLAGGAYVIPKQRLCKLPLINEFTRTSGLAQALFNEMNRGRTEVLTETVHLMSKWIEGYTNLAAAQVSHGGARLPMMDYIETHRRIPEHIVVDDREIPLVGVVEILASSRLLGDTDVLGGGGKRAGFVIERDALGMATRAKAVNIDAGNAFNFGGLNNRLSQSFHPKAVASTCLADRRDIQFGNNQAYDIEWSKLSEDQRMTFLHALKSGLKMLRTPLLMRTLIEHGGAFNRIEEGLLTSGHVDELTEIWENSLQLQESEEIYGVELRALDTRPSAGLK